MKNLNTKALTVSLVTLAAMNVLSFAADRPVVIAHRGASGYLPEHTLEAKSMAHAQGADFIEQDVTLTKDGVPVVLHDVHVDTVSDVAKVFPTRAREDGRYYALDFTLAELQTLRFTERFNAKTGKAVYPSRFPLWKGSFKIATLEEELGLIAGLNASTGRTAGIYPEIKQPKWHRNQGHDISAIVLKMLRDHGYATKADRCWVQCFEWEEVQRIRKELGWEGNLLLLLGKGIGKDGTNYEHFKSPTGIAEAAVVVNGFGPELGAIVTGKSVTERQVSEFVSLAHQQQCVVHPYTLRIDELPKWAADPADAMQVLFSEAKVDGLFSDFPDVCVDWLKANGR